MSCLHDQLTKCEKAAGTYWRLPEVCWVLSPVTAPTTASFLPSSLSPTLIISTEAVLQHTIESSAGATRYPRVHAEERERKKPPDSPLDVTLRLGSGDLGLAFGVLLLACGGPRAGLGGASGGLIGGFDAAADELLRGAEEGVDLCVNWSWRRMAARGVVRRQRGGKGECGGKGWDDERTVG